MSTKCRILKTNFDCKKKILCNRFAVSMRHKKVVKSNQLILPDQFFSIAKINLAFLDSHWRYSITKKIEKKEDNFCQFTNFSLSLFKTYSALGLPGLFVVVIVEKNKQKLLKNA